MKQTKQSSSNSQLTPTFFGSVPEEYKVEGLAEEVITQFKVNTKNARFFIQEFVDHYYITDITFGVTLGARGLYNLE